jgi:hypothetical protein
MATPPVLNPLVANVFIVVAICRWFGWLREEVADSARPTILLAIRSIWRFRSQYARRGPRIELLRSWLQAETARRKRGPQAVSSEIGSGLT